MERKIEELMEEDQRVEERHFRICHGCGQFFGYISREGRTHHYCAGCTIRENREGAKQG